MNKNGNSNNIILLPIIDQMTINSSPPSPCTLHRSLSSLLVCFCVLHGFDPGVHDCSPAAAVYHKILVGPPFDYFYFLMTSKVDDSNRVLEILVIALQLSSKIAIESLGRGEEGCVIGLSGFTVR
jgi:hypothetical protein